MRAKELNRLAINSVRSRRNSGASWLPLFAEISMKANIHSSKVSETLSATSNTGHKHGHKIVKYFLSNGIVSHRVLSHINIQLNHTVIARNKIMIEGNTYSEHRHNNNWVEHNKYTSCMDRSAMYVTAVRLQ